MENKTNIIISVEELVIAFGNFKAVDHISFDVKKGEIFGFLGANGAGKTTTIRTICGILNPTSGKVIVNGQDVSAHTAVLKPHIGYMSQKFTLYPDLSVNENMAFAGSLYNMDPQKIKSQTKRVSDFIDLEASTEEPVRHLSGGVKQMVALAATLLHDPDLVFLDEPTAGTSPQTRKKFWDLIQELAKQGKTIFVTTHYMDEAEYCDRIVLMDRGKIVAFDTPEGLKKEFFKIKPFELKFKKPVQRFIEKEIRKQKIGEVGVFGSELRVNTENREGFDKFAEAHKEDFSYSEVEPTLEDVFLKAVSGRKEE